MTTGILKLILIIVFSQKLANLLHLLLFLQSNPAFFLKQTFIGLVKNDIHNIFFYEKMIKIIYIILIIVIKDLEMRFNNSNLCFGKKHNLF